MTTETDIGLKYDPGSGVFTWVRTGREAGCLRADGYRLIRVGGRLHYAQRLAFKMMGQPVPRFVDHINGIPSDNRWNNLRPATHAQNMANARRKKTNISSRYKGVSWVKRDRMWKARITVGRRPIQIGTFIDEHTAARAYNAAALRFFGEYARLNEVGDGD